MSENKRSDYRTCTRCNGQYLGGTKCPCGSTATKSIPGGEDVTKKTFDEPDLKKGF